MMKKALFTLVLISVFSAPVFAATIVIENKDGAGEGFNDPTNSATIPNQKGNNPGATLGQLRLNVFNEAAKVLGVSMKTVENQMAHALRAVRSALEMHRKKK